MVGWDSRGDPPPSPRSDRLGEFSATTAERMDDGSHGTASLRRHLANAEEAFRRRPGRRVGLDPVTPSVGILVNAGSATAVRGGGLRGLDPPTLGSGYGGSESMGDFLPSDWEGYDAHFGTTSQSWSQSTVNNLEAEEDDEVFSEGVIDERKKQKFILTVYSYPHP